MGVTSKTGLLASTTKKLIRNKTENQVHLKVIATSAPYALKPLAGIYNPYPYGCSLLCNHPTDTDAKELLKRAKESWASEGKNLLLSDEVEAIRASLNQLQVKVSNFGDHYYDRSLPIENVPEELFRRYTETDSRPLTPAPTLVSAHTRASGSRRCVTPDPMLNTDVREKTQLILDLRRSHSQETFSWYGSIPQPEVPAIRVHEEDERKSSCTPEALKKTGRRSKTPSPVKHDKIEKTYLKVNTTDGDEADESEGALDDDEEDGIIKRRGRKRRKRGRDSSRGPPAFQSSIDPETQIATIGPESHNPSARPSLVPTDSLLPETLPVFLTTHGKSSRRSSIEVNSFLDKDCLKLFSRELNDEAIDNEFNLKRRVALEETMKTYKPKKHVCQELEELQSELKKHEPDANLWLNIPRMFSRSSARFELPMDSRQLSVMTPLKYVAEYVHVSDSRKQLYNHIFNKYINENEFESDRQRNLPGKNILTALNCVMSNTMSEKQGLEFGQLVGWKDDDTINFKTFCGLSALCERLLAPDYPLLILPKKDDPCHEIEIIDFKFLEDKLLNQSADANLVQILFAIRNS